jgi:DNA-directed RNA polymerase specialized sigma24 family protein
MRRVKKVLRLRFELGLGQRQIARSCGMGLSTVHGLSGLLRMYPYRLLKAEDRTSQPRCNVSRR